MLAARLKVCKCKCHNVSKFGLKHRTRRPEVEVLRRDFYLLYSSRLQGGKQVDQRNQERAYRWEVESGQAGVRQLNVPKCGGSRWSLNIAG